MPVFGPNNVFLGATQVAKAYLGGTLLFDITGPALDPDALAYINAVETADGQALEADVKDAINDFVVGCKADAIWDALKASCILAGARTLNGCLVPLVGAAPTNFNFVSADYNRKTGLKGDGNTKVLDSNRNNNADPQNNNHNAVFITEAPSSNSSFIGAGAVVSGANAIGYTGATLDSFFLRNRPSITGADNVLFSQGFAGFSRSLSENYTFRNASTDTSIAKTSATPRDANVLVFDRSESQLRTDARMSFYSIGEAIDLAALDTRVSALMTALDGAIA